VSFCHWSQTQLYVSWQNSFYIPQKFHFTTDAPQKNHLIDINLQRWSLTFALVSKKKYREERKTIFCRCHRRIIPDNYTFCWLRAVNAQWFHSPIANSLTPHTNQHWRGNRITRARPVTSGNTNVSKKRGLKRPNRFFCQSLSSSDSGCSSPCLLLSLSTPYAAQAMLRTLVKRATQEYRGATLKWMRAGYLLLWVQ
jgi:hypothetical protein